MDAEEEIQKLFWITLRPTDWCFKEPTPTKLQQEHASTMQDPTKLQEELPTQDVPVSELQ